MMGSVLKPGELSTKTRFFSFSHCELNPNFVAISVSKFQHSFAEIYYPQCIATDQIVDEVRKHQTLVNLFSNLICELEYKIQNVGDVSCPESSSQCFWRSMFRLSSLLDCFAVSSLSCCLSSTVLLISSCGCWVVMNANFSSLLGTTLSIMITKHD